MRRRNGSLKSTLELNALHCDNVGHFYGTPKMKFIAFAFLFLIYNFAHGKSFNVMNAPRDVLFEEVSLHNENLHAFLIRISPLLQSHTKETGHEACGVIASNGNQYSLIATTSYSHIYCLNDSKIVANGFSPIGENIHTHPINSTYLVNKQDRRMLGRFIDLGSQQAKGPKGFSPEDFMAGSGYLIEGNELLYQNSPLEVRLIGTFVQP